MRPPTDPDWRCARCLRQRPYVRRHGIRPTCDRCNGELRAKGLKWCAGCAKARPLAEFGPAQDRPRCRSCTADAQRARPRVWTEVARARHRARALAHYHRRRAADPGYLRTIYDQRRARRLRRFIQSLRGEQP